MGSYLREQGGVFTFRGSRWYIMGGDNSGVQRKFLGRICRLRFSLT